MHPCYESGLDRFFQVILGLSNPLVGNSLILLSNLQQRCFLDLGSSIVCCKYYPPVFLLWLWYCLIFWFSTYWYFCDFFHLEPSLKFETLNRSCYVFFFKWRHTNFPYTLKPVTDTRNILIGDLDSLSLDGLRVDIFIWKTSFFQL